MDPTCAFHFGWATLFSTEKMIFGVSPLIELGDLRGNRPRSHESES